MYHSFDRLNPKHVFDCFCEVAGPVAGDPTGKPWVLQKYPENYSDEEVLKSLPDFVFPCEFDRYDFFECSNPQYIYFF
jgi:hypothetical protein